MKAAQDYLENANAKMPKMEAGDAIAKHAAGQGIFIDVRDSGAIAETGTIKGASRVPRGMTEFRADPGVTDFHNPIFPEGRRALSDLGCGRAGGALWQDVA